jgi:hypothetical protein
MRPGPRRGTMQLRGAVAIRKDPDSRVVGTSAVWQQRMSRTTLILRCHVLH